MRTISTAALNALDSGWFDVRCLLKISLDDPEPPFCVWDDVGNIELAGDTYFGAAGRFTVQPATSTKDQSVRNLDLTLSGLDADALALISSSAWHQRPITVQRAIIPLGSPGVLHVMPEFSGFLDQAIIRETPGGASTMIFRCESASRAFDRGSARRRSDADQRVRDPNDGFYEFAAAAVSTPIDWGGVPPQKPKATGLAKLLRKIF